MLAAILFDLDGTLVDLDGDAFLEDYTEKLSGTLSEWIAPARFKSALWSAAVGALATPHPTQTNRAVLMHQLAAALDVSPDWLWAHIDAFNRTQTASVLPGGRPRPGAQDVVHLARQRGLKIALATTPIYDLPVVEERLGRAGLRHIPWDVVATDLFQSTKPYPAYYQEIARRLDVAPEDCLMVGDDAFNDLAAAHVGMHTFYVGPAMGGLEVGPAGTLEDLAEWLARSDLPWERSRPSRVAGRELSE
ncbi:MAG: HAD family hydrolase [Firmicutes bacterium]|nr:HAD family hydrolase [Bacillota bacterium]